MINPIGANTIVNSSTSAKEKNDQEKLGSFEKALENAVNEKDQKKLKDACKSLETVFVNMLFKEMRSTIDKSKLFDEDYSEETYQDMLFEKYADEISKNKGIGISDMLYKQLSKNMNIKSEE